MTLQGWLAVVDQVEKWKVSSPSYEAIRCPSREQRGSSSHSLMLWDILLHCPEVVNQLSACLLLAGKFKALSPKAAGLSLEVFAHDLFCYHTLGLLGGAETSSSSARMLPLSVPASDYLLGPVTSS